MASFHLEFNQTLVYDFHIYPFYPNQPTQKNPNTRKLIEQPWLQTKG